MKVIYDPVLDKLRLDTARPVFPGGENIKGITTTIVDDDELIPTSGAVYRAMEDIIAGAVVINKTKVDILKELNVGYQFDLTQSNIGDYTLEGDFVSLGETENIFLGDKKLFIHLNGIELDKRKDISWISETHFSIYTGVDSNDQIFIRRVQ